MLGLFDGVDWKLWGFTFTLGHSRAMMATAAFCQSTLVT
jgi:hypothetical protein